MIPLVDAETSLETPRLVLEPLTLDHAISLLIGLQHCNLYRFIPQDPPHSLEELAERFRRLAARRSPDGSEGWLNWALRLAGTSTFVGTAQATVQLDKSAFIAYMIFAPFQRMGYGKEALGRVLQHLQKDYSIDRIIAEIDARNLASQSLARSLGLELIEIRRDVDFFKGNSSDEHHYEWRSGNHDRSLINAE